VRWDGGWDGGGGEARDQIVDLGEDVEGLGGWEGRHARGGSVLLHWSC